MKKLLFVILVILFVIPRSEAARLFVAASSNKVTPSEGLIQGGSWTIAVWFKAASTPTAGANYTLFTDGSGTNRWNPLITYDSSLGLNLAVVTSSTFGVLNISRYNVTLTVGQWYHLAFVSGDQGAGNAFKVYVDGVSQTWSVGGAYANESNHGGQPVIGASYDAGFFCDCTIGEIGRWAANSGDAAVAALNDAEILALSRGADPEKVHILPASGTARQYVWRLEGWQTTEPDIGTRHTAPATVTGAVRANGPPVIPR
jgi:hypothetical protein